MNWRLGRTSAARLLTNILGHWTCYPLVIFFLLREINASQEIVTDLPNYGGAVFYGSSTTPTSTSTSFTSATLSGKPVIHFFLVIFKRARAWPLMQLSVHYLYKCFHIALTCLLQVYISLHCSFGCEAAVLT